MTRTIRRLALAAGLGLLLAPQGRADGPKEAAVEPGARRLFDDVVKAYKALPAYADHGTFTIGMKVDGKARDQTNALALTFARPNKLTLDAGTVRIFDDGQKLATVLVPTKKYLLSDAPESLNMGALSEGPLGAVLLGGPSGPPALILLSLLAADDPAKAILEPTSALRLEADRKVDNEAHKALVLAHDDGPGVRLLVEPKRKLIKRIEIMVDPDSLKDKAPEGVKLSDFTIAWDSGVISTEPAKAAAFAFEPPAGFSEIKPGERVQAPADEPKNPLVGKPAPDFSFTMLAKDGKTKTVSRDDLKGKVVVIDFWATWCPPCRAELPEIQEMIEALAKKHGEKDVLVVALSEDREPDDGKPLRKLVEDCLKDELKLDLARTPVGRVALDPTNAVGEAFGVEGIPTVVLIDAKGVVQAIHVGYNKGVGEELRGDVEKLLGGGSLLEEAGEEKDQKK